MPVMSASVIAKTSRSDFLPARKAPVYSGRPRSAWMPSMARSRWTPARSPSISGEPKPTWGMTVPVIIHEIAPAGIRKATMRTQYWATWV